ncbi:hypothetical protein H3V53_03095 [Paraburkholderia bengalensis]|uniref:Uncharacterized protein n=1 Tax=Paraburkholderia bengalensis TaxID=2747562 RepID=A0ABU8IKV8_9BURK
MLKDEVRQLERSVNTLMRLPSMFRREDWTAKFLSIAGSRSSLSVMENLKHGEWHAPHVAKLPLRVDRAEQQRINPRRAACDITRHEMVALPH